MKKVYYYDKETGVVQDVSQSKTMSDATYTHRVINMMHRSEADGSYLDKPMSKTYIDHIRSRNSRTIERMKPNMGAYGA